MTEAERDRPLPQPGAEPDVRAGELTAAANRLFGAIEALNQAFLSDGAVERAEARDRFDIALASYMDLIDTA